MNEPTPGTGAPRTVPVEAGGALNPFVGRNVAWLLRHRRDEHPERECLVWWPLEGEPRRWTYARLVDAVEATAGAMINRGIAPRLRLHPHEVDRRSSGASRRRVALLRRA